MRRRRRRCRRRLLSPSLAPSHPRHSHRDFNYIVGGGCGIDDDGRAPQKLYRRTARLHLNARFKLAAPTRAAASL